MAEALTSDQIYNFYETLLKNVLTKHNPSGLKTIGMLLKQFPGKEHQVFVQICKKCGVEPRGPPTPDDFVDGVPKELGKPSAASDGKVSKWLFENGFEKYSKQHQFQTMSWDDFITISSKGKLIELGVIPKHAQGLLVAIIKLAGQGASQPPPEYKADFEVEEDCYTKVVTMSKDKTEGEKWLNARVTNVNTDNTFDIFVYNSNSHGVPPEAVNVPRKMLKKSTEKVEVAVPEEKPVPKRARFQHGDRIRVFGLRSHTTYNNLCGTVLIYVPSERRYQVRLDTNDVIAIKQRNVTSENADPQTAVAMESGRIKLREAGGTKNDEANLSALLLKLMRDNPNTDPKRLGEFAAGYLLAKQKLDAEEDN